MSAYAYSNSAMERLCEQRHEEGLPGLAIQWGPISEVGMVANLGIVDTADAVPGTKPQSIRSCLSTLDCLLHQHHPVMSAFVLTEKTVNKEKRKPFVPPSAVLLGAGNGSGP